MKFKQMKKIYKNNKMKFLVWGLAITFAVSLGIFVQGCSQEDDFMDNITNDNNVKYLDLDVTNTTSFTKTELDLMANAVKRISDHLVFDKDNNKYVFSLKSPVEINVSERLFNYIYSGMGTYTTNNIPRLKDDCECTTVWGIGYYQTSCGMTDQQTIGIMQGMNNFYSLGGYPITVSGLLLSFKASPYVGFVTSMASALLGAEASTWSQMYNQYVNTSNRTGSTFSSTTFTASTVPYTVNQFNYPKK